MLELGVISLMPEMFQSLHFGVTGRALDKQLARLRLWNPRDWAPGPHHAVDDKPYGGGPGMVMCYEPLMAAIRHARQQMPSGCKTVYLSPQGRQITQQDLNAVAHSEQPLLFIAGRYEGIDERVLTAHVEEEWSLGDFVVSGGELAAMVFIDALIRLLPGSLGHAASAVQDSFMNGLLECPQYTRPSSVDGMAVPPVLLSGDHEAIALYRRKESLGNTWLKRPDLLDSVVLSTQDKQLLEAFKNEKRHVS